MLHLFNIHRMDIGRALAKKSPSIMYLNNSSDYMTLEYVFGRIGPYDGYIGVE